MRICLLIATGLFSSLGFSTSMISSDEAHLKGKDLFLEGHVSVSHPSFHLEAEKASLFGYDEGHDLPFSEVALDQSTHLLIDGYRIQCREATLNLETLTGSLKSPGERVYIFDETNSDFALVGDAIDFSLIHHPTKLHHFAISNFKAKEQIELTHQNSLKLFCDEIELDRHLLSPISTRLIARATKPQNECLCEYLHDKIQAQTIEYDPLKERLSMTHAHGNLHSLYQNISSERTCEIEAEALLWDQITHQLTLTGFSKLTDPYLGSLECEDTLLIQQLHEFDHYVIQTIQTQGKARLTYFDEEDRSLHYLSCPGSITFDRHYLTIVATSKESADENEQTFYENEDMIMYADEISIEYTLRNFILKAHKVHLKGNLKCIAKNPEKEFFQYALADELIYLPLENKTHLHAHTGSKVLFWNEKQFLKISADAIDIIHNENTMRETIKGKGHVRLYFNPEEERMLQDLLSTFSKFQQPKFSHA